ncbi:MAG: SLC13 family permease [Candidatus Methylacidiphilales bacterium]
MNFDWQIVFMLLLVAAFLVTLMREWVRPDVASMTALCLLLIFGVLKTEEAFGVFSNTAPITVAGMFVLSYALQRTGVVEKMGRLIGRSLPSSLRPVILGVCSLAALCSAFINNTPVVAIFMPLLLGLARDKNLPASRLLLPLSFASIMGGCCTVIGTSTNILVNGVAVQYGLQPIAMFELAWLGVPFLIAGLVYLAIFAPILIPNRNTLTSTLGEDERKTFLCQVLVKEGSPLIGQKLVDTALAKKKSDFRIIEVRRQGTRLLQPINEIVVRPFDRIMISSSMRQMVQLPTIEGLTLDSATTGELGIENLSTIEGGIVEGLVGPHSKLLGRTIRQINFRQTYGMLILAVHRHGKNLDTNFQDTPLHFGDTILMLGPLSTFEQLREEGDFLLLEERHHIQFRPEKAPIAVAAIVAVVVVATLNIMPIVAATTIACVGLLLSRVLEPDEAYRSIDWQIIFLIYGSLAVGLAMENTGTALWISHGLIDGAQMLCPPELMPFVALAIIYFLTSALTEVLSNNAAAVILAPIAINLSQQLGVDPRPFIIAVMFGASASFVTPIGYQTNTMVYGAGGYRFNDFVRIGLPLNLLFWVGSTLLIPRIWPFHP